MSPRMEQMVQLSSDVRLSPVPKALDLVQCLIFWASATCPSGEREDVG